MRTRKSYYVVLLSVLVVLYVIVVFSPVAGLYNISEWIVFGFVVPFVYFITKISSKEENKKTSLLIFGLGLGLLIPVLLTRGTETFLVHKIAAVIIGSAVTWGVSKALE